MTGFIEAGFIEPIELTAKQQAELRSIFDKPELIQALPELIQALTEAKAEYELNLQFDRDRPRPIDVRQQLAQISQAANQLDQALGAIHSRTRSLIREACVRRPWLTDVDDVIALQRSKSPFNQALRHLRQAAAEAEALFNRQMTQADGVKAKPRQELANDRLTRHVGDILQQFGFSAGNSWQDAPMVRVLCSLTNETPSTVRKWVQKHTPKRGEECQSCLKMGGE